MIWTDVESAVTRESQCSVYNGAWSRVWGLHCSGPLGPLQAPGARPPQGPPAPGPARPQGPPGARPWGPLRTRPRARPQGRALGPARPGARPWGPWGPPALGPAPGPGSLRAVQP
jgi:hypothetical protein